jgi:hypothetical protein
VSSNHITRRSNNAISENVDVVVTISGAGGARLESPETTEVFRSFPLMCPGKCWDSIQIRPRLFFSKYFPVFDSPILLYTLYSLSERRKINYKKKQLYY